MTLDATTSKVLNEEFEKFLQRIRSSDGFGEVALVVTLHQDEVRAVEIRTSERRRLEGRAA